MGFVKEHQLIHQQRESGLHIGMTVVPQIIKMESIAEVNAASKLDTSEFQLQNGVLIKMYSNLPFEVSDSKLPRALADLDDSTLDGVEHPDHIQVQSFNFQMEATGSQVHDNSIVEEADEIKEIDEALLMELDVVGDFSVEEFGSNMNKVENNRVSVEEMNSEIPPIEARSIEDIDSNFRKTEPLTMKAEVQEVEIPHQSRIKEEIINSGIPVLETRSIQDMDIAFRQISEDIIKMPVVESVHFKVVPKETKAGCSEYEIYLEDSIITETKTELPVVEAPSFEDLDLAFKQFHISSSLILDAPDIVGSTNPVENDFDLHVERQIKRNSLDGRLDVLESKKEAETTSELHFTEARSLEHVGMSL